MHCLSRSLKVIGTDMDRSTTYNFLLLIHNNHEPISYSFRAFNAPTEGVTLGNSKGQWSSKCTATVLALDGQTDGYAITISCYEYTAH